MKPDSYKKTTPIWFHRMMDLIKISETEMGDKWWTDQYGVHRDTEQPGLYKDT